MIHPVPRSIVLLIAVLFSTVAIGLAQEKEVKKAPIQRTSPASGKEMYMSYCAACHGKDAKGDGPAASALKMPPTNLTMLAKENNGKFPEDHLTTVLRNGVSPAHGNADMPVWGPLFSSVSGRDQAVVNMRISNLVRYLESVQAK